MQRKTQQVQARCKKRCAAAAETNKSQRQTFLQTSPRASIRRIGLKKLDQRLIRAPGMLSEQAYM